MADLPSSQNDSSLKLTMAMPGHVFSSSPHSSDGGPSCMKDFDINQLPPGCEESLFGIGDEDYDYNGPPRKKLRLTREQSRLLEESFREYQTLNHRQKEALASQLKLKPRQVEVWFQNRRARTKLKQTEMEYEYLKRCFGSLTEENRRLQREVEQVRSMRVAPAAVISPYKREPLPVSTLSMCPRCERVTANPPANGFDNGSASQSSPHSHIFQPCQPSAACKRNLAETVERNFGM
ncbi:homeobox-leucine zipper protein HOX3-like [Aristolochia californica]|uniref:homeobox-leucine zipper protein HOX3-like n=1 Tax=Aristolochia californica TaxID=171875 RepID=UPI0035DCAD65